jgi:hypothetical protein
MPFMTSGSSTYNLIKIAATLFVIASSLPIQACQSGERLLVGENIPTPTSTSSEKSTVNDPPLANTIRSVPQLFSNSNIDITPENANDPTVIRSRAVNVNLALLNESEVDDKIILNLFDDTIFTAVLEKKEPTMNDGYTLTGYLDGIQYSQVILIVGGDQIAGNITLPGAFYEIRYTSNHVHAVYQIEQSAYPQEAEPAAPGK